MGISTAPSMRGRGSPACTSWVSMRRWISGMGTPACDCHTVPLPCPYAVMERRARAPCWSGPAMPQTMAAHKSPTERFSSRVADYVRYRPGYPPAALELLQRRCGLGVGAVVADLGSGTGILTQLLLESGADVIGVEPNDAMRAAAEQALAGNPRFRSVKGSAEASTLGRGSV